VTSTTKDMEIVSSFLLTVESLLHYCLKVWSWQDLPTFQKEVSYTHQDCIYIIKITVKTVILENIKLKIAVF